MASIDNIGKIEASVDDGGWRASGAVFNDADRLDFYQQIKAWVDLYAGGWEALPRWAFNGHLLPEKWKRVFGASSAPWKAFTGQEFLKMGEIQGIFFKDVPSPANDHQINGMTLASIVTHCLKYHCNLDADTYDEGILTLDIDNTNSVAITEYEIRQGNFWSKMQEIAEVDAYLIWVDKANVLHYNPHPMFSGSLPDSVMTITASHLLEPLEFERINPDAIGQVRVYGTTPAGLQIEGAYPTDPAGGPITSYAGYLATDDTLMDTIAERRYKFLTRDYTVTAKMPGGVGLLFDLLDRVSLTYASAGDGIDWTAKKFWIHKIEVDIVDGFAASTTLTLEAENA